MATRPCPPNSLPDALGRQMNAQIFDSSVFVLDPAYLATQRRQLFEGINTRQEFPSATLKRQQIEDMELRKRIKRPKKYSPGSYDLAPFTTRQVSGTTIDEFDEYRAESPAQSKASKPYNPNLRPAALASLPLDGPSLVRPPKSAIPHEPMKANEHATQPRRLQREKMSSEIINDALKASNGPDNPIWVKNMKQLKKREHYTDEDWFMDEMATSSEEEEEPKTAGPPPTWNDLCINHRLGILDELGEYQSLDDTFDRLALSTVERDHMVNEMRLSAEREADEDARILRHQEDMLRFEMAKAHDSTKPTPQSTYHEMIEKGLYGDLENMPEELVTDSVEVAKTKSYLKTMGLDPEMVDRWLGIALSASDLETESDFESEAAIDGNEAAAGENTAADGVRSGPETIVVAAKASGNPLKPILIHEESMGRHASSARIRRPVHPSGGYSDETQERIFARLVDNDIASLRGLSPPEALPTPITYVTAPKPQKIPKLKIPEPGRTKPVRRIIRSWGNRSTAPITIGESETSYDEGDQPVEKIGSSDSEYHEPSRRRGRNRRPVRAGNSVARPSRTAPSGASRDFVDLSASGGPRKPSRAPAPHQGQKSRAPPRENPLPSSPGDTIVINTPSQRLSSTSQTQALATSITTPGHLFSGFDSIDWTLRSFLSEEASTLSPMKESTPRKRHGQAVGQQHGASTTSKEATITLAPAPAPAPGPDAGPGLGSTIAGNSHTADPHRPAPTTTTSISHTYSATAVGPPAAAAGRKAVTKSRGQRGGGRVAKKIKKEKALTSSMPK
ncbi:MAG: hypothetical protein M1819_005311 [Sarea resinae]|nr:MAG: hypothetical protein M1819_005311 [Sarea resinae]